MLFSLIVLKNRPNFAEKDYRMKRIYVERKVRKELDERFGQPNVSKAFTFVSNSLLSRQIRHLALNEYNGKIINL